MEDFGRSLLVLGGARSGKSRHGQSLAEATGGRLVYVATAQALDAEMEDRISRHRADRDMRWETVEAPIHLAAIIAEIDAPGVTMLVDCLTLWTSNLLLADDDIPDATRRLQESVKHARGQLILIANEVGLGIVPDNALARRFRDAAGTLNQRIAEAVDTVDFVLAGLPRRWKG